MYALYFTKKNLEKEYHSKVAGYKINIQKSIDFSMLTMKYQKGNVKPKYLLELHKKKKKT